MSNANRRRAVLGGLLCAAFMGCSPSTLWFLFKGDEKTPAKYALEPKDGRSEIAVLVIVTSSPGLGMDEFAGVDRDIALQVGRRLVEDTKDEKPHITVIDPAKLERLKSTPGQDWRTLSPAAIGAKLGADYVIDVDLTAMMMLPPKYGGEYYEGSASYDVVVYDTAHPDAAYRQYSYTSATPLKGKESVTASMYRKMLLERVATDIAWHHVPHLSNRDSAPIR